MKGSGSLASPGGSGIIRGGFRGVFGGPLGGTAFHEGQGNPFLNDFAVLVDNPAFPGNHATPAAGAYLFFENLTADPNGIADENRAAKLPIADAQQRQGAHGRRG